MCDNLSLNKYIDLNWDNFVIVSFVRAPINFESGHWEKLQRSVFQIVASRLRAQKIGPGWQILELMLDQPSNKSDIGESGVLVWDLKMRQILIYWYISRSEASMVFQWFVLNWILESQSSKANVESLFSIQVCRFPKNLHVDLEV